jgi:hypothetical protein
VLCAFMFYCLGRFWGFFFYLIFFSVFAEKKSEEDGDSDNVSQQPTAATLTDPDEKAAEDSKASEKGAGVTTSVATLKSGATVSITRTGIGEFLCRRNMESLIASSLLSRESRHNVFNAWSRKCAER